ncbi:MAG: matrixin family metalloprotease [Chitinophagaceae bacterium]|nr:matrixin family metalloprotease [Chitinophagaceae bacterium]
MKKISFLLLLFVSLKASTQVLYDNGKLTPPSPKFTVTPKFVVIGTWGKTNISFFFQNGTADIAGTAEQNSVIQGMQLWSAYTPLTFTQAASAGAADIVISWATFAVRSLRTSYSICSFGTLSRI